MEIGAQCVDYLWRPTTKRMDEQYWTMCKIIHGENPIVLDFTGHKIVMLHACRVHKMTQGVNCHGENEVDQDHDQRSLSGLDYDIDYAHSFLRQSTLFAWIAD